MGKYSPLRTYLMAQTRERIPMSFKDIERLLGEKLPASKQYPAWWSNNPSNNPMTKEWLAAGFQTESVNIAGENLIFRRSKADARQGSGQAYGKSAGGLTEARSSGRRPGFIEDKVDFNNAPHMSGENEEYIVPPRGADPLFGCMAGTLTLLPDVDYTAPADPDWGKVYDD
ncbi:hypothetical protein EN742_07020 [Mesorhizobium sp. M4A.F.Ca.ET.020.02.1.1]|uniref:DUF7662 domain-containing protein n=1 Tax=unclassified Mesorhizobium TaxID=325217 RepID=UPI000FCBDECB|nr:MULTISPECIES: hypothetical protein [unclassified Mesorhizobium]RUX50304.1 hypothetical protein EOA33_09905 [Mesorhizobium sp. M4A.F.Ca.ET.050.02.1.1]RVD42675.1 hypothetical protein EN742_07020 [Mesorhizobium sp. M4A.F.Ca.ET.020.02.1.1]RWC18982.1 MAG: hypothetical protein EOS53_14700 [Mesorhizobium sp.]RWD25275.1 MAG: hypothetical protein EOS33_23250 [Mesorhizobium sp.]TIL79158.1 MAG: hypothetical protein E5Y89_13310 [Mesorhizobium sp.]